MDERYLNWFRQSVKAVEEAGQLLLDRRRAEQVMEKGRTDYVTEVDLSVQSFLAQRLGEIAPEVTLMGEEQDNAAVDPMGLIWVLDPVDGTTNLIHDFRHSAISLALAEGGTVLAGVVYIPWQGELYTAIKDKGAYFNHKPIHVSNVERLADALCSVGTNPGSRENADRAFEEMRKIYDQCHDIRRIGAASIELCYVAAGRLDSYLEHDLKPWDYGAGMLIVKEAGGIATDEQGRELSLSHPCSVLAGNGSVHRQLLELLKGE